MDKYALISGWKYRLIFILGVFAVVLSYYFFLRTFDVQGFWGWFLLIGESIVAISTIIAWSINWFTKGFSKSRHEELVSEYALNLSEFPAIDIYLPVCGEPLRVLGNTWEGVSEIDYPNYEVYVLDDKGDGGVKELARQYGFNYLSRPDKGKYKKSGNLKYGFDNSSGEYSLILDADFRPNPSILRELLPYMDDEKVAIVQSPQTFPMQKTKENTHLEVGAATIQTYFFKVIQSARNSLGATVCCGSCALYRRSALEEIGGSILIDHSEDIWNGLTLQSKGWKVRYIPVKLSEGLCPDRPDAYYKQQSRWCNASLSIVGSQSFWKMGLPWYSKLCYVSSFLYYVCTILYLLLPLVAIVTELFDPEEIGSGILLMPSLVVLLIVWGVLLAPNLSFNAIYVQIYCYWISAFTVIRKVFGREEDWVPTGAFQKISNFNILKGVIFVWLVAYSLLFLVVLLDDGPVSPTVLVWSGSGWLFQAIVSGYLICSGRFSFAFNLIRSNRNVARKVG